MLTAITAVGLLTTSACTGATPDAPAANQVSSSGAVSPPVAPATPHDGRTQQPDVAAVEPAPAPLLWSSKETIPASDVANVAGRPMVIATKDKHLEIQELNLSTGHVEWAHRVSSSMVPPQVPMQVTALKGRYVAVLEPLTGPGKRARLRLLDVTQRGKAVADSGIHQFTSFPHICDDDPGAVCAQGLTGVKPVEVRLTWQGVQSSTPLPDGDSYEDLGVHGLVRFLEPRTRRSSIGVVKDGKLVWHREEKDIFGRYSPSAGWVFNEVDGVIFGTVGLPKAGRAHPMPARKFTVAFDARTGQTRWSLPRTDLGCSAREDVVLVCEWQAGTVRPDGFVDSGRMVVTRIDPATGDRLWTTRPFFVDGKGAGQLGDSGEGVVVNETTGRAVIDVATGNVRAALPSDITWRRVAVELPSADQHFKGSTPVNSRRGVVNRTEPVLVPERFYQPIPLSVGAAFEGLRVVALEGRVVALRLR